MVRENTKLSPLVGCATHKASIPGRGARIGYYVHGSAIEGGAYSRVHPELRLFLGSRHASHIQTFHPSGIGEGR